MELTSQSSHTAAGYTGAVTSSDGTGWATDMQADKTSAELLSMILKQLDDDKAEDITTIDLDGKSDVADAMVIASGRSQRHVGALADKIMRELKTAGCGKVSLEGMPACDWVLIDAGDLIVHLFRPEVREFYNLERIWSPETFADTTEKTKAN
jgi:ribosome-associated protein